VEIVVVKQAQKELEDAPREVIEDVYALFEDLAAGKHLSLPISRPLPSIAKGLHELRLSFSGGEYRVFYVIRTKDAIYVIHATQKKTQSLDRRAKELLKLRMKRLGL
jgi:phage-related protein